MEIKVFTTEQKNLKEKGFFFVGGIYKGMPGKRYMDGQMFVEVYVPKKILHPYPLIFMHGAGQTNLNWLGTPDGRKGWADYFIEKGYVVYLAEQPARGRSAYHQEDGPTKYHSVEDIESRFAGRGGKWKTAELHTQWPDEGMKIGSEVFDQFAASQVEFLASNKKSQEMVFAAAGELLEKTGPAILVTHSQAGAFGWKIGDAYPEFIKGIIALEPSGPPFSVRLDSDQAENYALCDLPMNFVPEVHSTSDFKLRLLSSDKPEERDGWVMDEKHLYKLPGLGQVPVLLMTAEASYHTQYDHLVSYVLNQLGVRHDFVKLGEIGIHGNSHFMMIEKNNLEIAAWIDSWITKRIE